MGWSKLQSMDYMRHSRDQSQGKYSHSIPSHQQASGANPNSPHHILSPPDARLHANKTTRYTTPIGHSASAFLPRMQSTSVRCSSVIATVRSDHTPSKGKPLPLIQEFSPSPLFRDLVLPRDQCTLMQPGKRLLGSRLKKPLSDQYGTRSCAQMKTVVDFITPPQLPWPTP
jgi:hypothetical protein